MRVLQEKGLRISVVSHGGREDYAYASQFPDMRILCNSLGIPARVYDRRVHQVHWRQILRSQVARSFDANGLIATMRAGWAWHMPVIAHASYLPSELLSTTNPGEKRLIERQRGRERVALGNAALVSVPTQELADKIVELVPATATKLIIMPNFVDPEKFRPIPSTKPYDLVYVGRISAEKNLSALLEAVKHSGITIAMIGGGATSEFGGSADSEILKLKERFGDLDGNIDWQGVINNQDLPRIINQAKAFVLCSLSEGHPRALIEAMACGMPIIGSNVPGIQNVLQHEVTGYLCDTDADSIAAAISTVLSKPALMQKMGENARKFAVDNYSLEQLAQREYELLIDIARRNPVDPAPKRLAQYVFSRR